MENVFVGIGFTSTHESDWIDDSHPDFPCTVFSNPLEYEKNIASACYYNQSFLWGRPLENFNVDAALEGCNRTPPQFKEACFIGLGFNFAFPPLYKNNDVVIATCNRVPIAYRDHCIAGVILVRATTWEGFNYESEKQTFCGTFKKNTEQCSKRFDDITSFIIKR